jgi:hypothetical protein
MEEDPDEASFPGARRENSPIPAAARIPHKRKFLSGLQQSPQRPDVVGEAFPADMKVKGYLCMVYDCFLDDSKDKDQTRLMVSAGFFGTKEDWGSLRVAWKKVLKKHDIDYFKSREQYWLEGQFAKFKTDAYPTPKGRDAANQVRSELQAVLERHPSILGIAITVPLEAYNRVLSRPEAKEALPANPYCAALNSVMFETVKRIKNIRGHNMVAFVHDDGPDFNSLRSSYGEFKKLNPNTAKFMGGFIPCDDKDYPEIQAADMISNYTMQLGLDCLTRGDLKAKVKEMIPNIRLLGFWN